MSCWFCFAPARFTELARSVRVWVGGDEWLQTHGDYETCGDCHELLTQGDVESLTWRSAQAVQPYVGMPPEPRVDAARRLARSLLDAWTGESMRIREFEPLSMEAADLADETDDDSWRLP